MSRAKTYQPCKECGTLFYHRLKRVKRCVDCRKRTPSTGTYLPTQEEIAAACEKIRAEHSRADTIDPRNLHSFRMPKVYKSRQ